MSLLTRVRMLRIVRMLQNKAPNASVIELIQDPRYLRAINALEGAEQVTTLYTDGKDYPDYVSLCGKGHLYTLERGEVWMNRIGGFVSGVLTTVLSGVILWKLTGG